MKLWSRPSAKDWASASASCSWFVNLSILIGIYLLRSPRLNEADPYSVQNYMGTE